MNRLSEYISGIDKEKLENFLELANHVHISEDWEVLVGLLDYREPTEETTEIAFNLLHEFGSLPAILSQPVQSMVRVEGVTPSIAQCLLMVNRAVRLVAEKRIFQKPALNNWQAIENYCRTVIGFRGQQNVVAIYLDEEFRPIRAEHLSKGTVDRVSAYPREVITRALQLDAYSVILAKNVPSGRLKPKPCETEFSLRLEEACNALEIHLTDFVLVGKSGVRSMLRN